VAAIQNYFLQAELALAAYANLVPGTPNTDELVKSSVGMSPTQAASFAERWRVIAQHTDVSTGLSATVFQATAGGAKFLAVRGTESQLGDLMADGLLALGIPSGLNPQFAALKTKVTAWLADGTLGGSFSAAGHSLGGYLAAALKEVFAAQVTDAYMFNAPGVGGVVGSVANLFSSAFGLTGTTTTNVWNLRGSEGASVITGLGSQLSEPIRIQIEAAGGLGFANHSIVRMTDALAVHAMLGELFPDLQLGQLGGIIDASGAVMSDSLEGALDAVRLLLLGGATQRTPTDDRDALHANLLAVRGNAAYQSLRGAAATLLYATPAEQIATAALADTAAGMAVRYALQALNPFAVTAAGYAIHNVAGALDLYNAATGTGALTSQYLSDRANLLERKLWFSTDDINPVNPAYAHNGTDPLFLRDDTYFEDAASGYRIAQGFHPDAPHANIHRTYFGDATGNTYAGGSVDDRLYGGAGKDKLTGNGGADYLEGNADADRLDGGAGVDILDGGTGNDQLMGGIGLDEYRIGRNAGLDIVTDFAGGDGDGLGSLVYAGQALGGVLTPDSGDPQRWHDARGLGYHFTGSYGSRGLLTISDPSADAGHAIQVRNWMNGELGLSLPPPLPIVKTSKSGDGEDNILAADSINQKVYGLAGNDRISSCVVQPITFGYRLDMLRRGGYIHRLAA